MQLSNNLLQALTATGFTFASDQSSVTGLPQPPWVHSDDIDVLIDHILDDSLQIEVRFTHCKALMEYGSDPDSLLGMKEHCSSVWFPELEQRFKKVADYFNLGWREDGDVGDEVIPILSYCLVGEFPVAQTDRILALLLEVRSVLGG